MRKIISITVVFLACAVATFLLWPNHNSLRTNGKLSVRSDEQLWKAMRLPHIIGGYVVKTKFTKEESPLLWVGSYHPGVIKVAADYITKTGGAKGVGSEFFKNNDKDSQVIVDAVHKGQITCEMIENASVSKMVPGLLQYVKSMCFMPVPAFDSNFPQIMVFMFDVPLQEQDVNVRKELLKVQLEITTREYAGEDVPLLK